VETIDTGAQRRLRITANPTALAKLRSRFDRYWKVEEVVTGERYGTIELLEYDAAAERFVPVITSPVAVTGDPRTVQDTVDSFWLKYRQKFKPDYNPVSEKYFERNPSDPYE
jgi:hypothetical protein